MGQLADPKCALNSTTTKNLTFTVDASPWILGKTECSYKTMHPHPYQNAFFQAKLTTKKNTEMAMQQKTLHPN